MEIAIIDDDGNILDTWPIDPNHDFRPSVSLEVAIGLLIEHKMPLDWEAMGE